MLDRRGASVCHADVTWLHRGIEMSVQEVRDRLSQGVGSHASVVIGEKRGRIANIVVNIFEKCIMAEDATCC